MFVCFGRPLAATKEDRVLDSGRGGAEAAERGTLEAVQRHCSSGWAERCRMLP
jgi:hypothetical protein